REHDESKRQSHEHEAGRSGERREQDEEGGPAEAEREEDPIRTSSIGQGPREDLPDGTEAERQGERACPDEPREEGQGSLVRDPREEIDQEDPRERGRAEGSERDRVDRRAARSRAGKALQRQPGEPERGG